MFERFTERARQVVVLAQEEARVLGHNHIGTEHVLLGLLRTEDGLAAKALRQRGITAESAREQVALFVGAGEEVTSGQIPFTPRATKLLELASREGLSLGHQQIGTEHLLLGLLRDNDGVAIRVLEQFQVKPPTLRDEVMRMLAGPRSASEWAPPDDARAPAARSVAEPRGALPVAPPPVAPPPPRQSWLHGFEWLLGRLEHEIRETLGREPDVGDLLLVLSTVPGTLASDALRERAIEPDELWVTLERVRKERERARAEMGRKLEEIRREKDRAVEAAQLDRAVELRDQERELLERLVGVSISPDALAEIRRRLGIPGSGA